MYTKDQFLSCPEVTNTYLEIREFYMEKNEEQNMGIPQDELESLAFSRACAEVYVQFCKEGKMPIPEKCKECPCGKKIPYPEEAAKYSDEKEYLVCAMAPPYVLQQPNLLISERPSYCPMNEKDELQEALNLFAAKQNGPVQ